MSLKKMYLIFFTILSIASVNAQTRYAKIVVYRIENIREKTEEGYKIFTDDNLTANLTNNHFEEFFMPEGRFRLRVNTENPATQIVECSKGSTYYFKIYRNLNLPTKPITINSVDSITAKNEIKQMKRTHYKHTVGSNMIYQDAIGLVLEPVTGFNKVGVLKTTDGAEGRLSFGGEGAIGLSYSHELTENYGYLIELQDRFGSIFLDDKNSTVDFNTGMLSVSPYFVIPVDLKIAQKFKLGLGLDYYFNPTLTYYYSEKMVNGFNDVWNYNNALGYHILFFIETKVGKKLKVHTGLKYSDVQYSFASSKTHQPSDNNLRNPHGNSLAVSLGLEYCF
ncbi:MAG: hypothetical protein Q8904_10205 [Bacteroidota bacterium]|nr:hypothetical protein [Bacteroidota bacterium]